MGLPSINISFSSAASTAIARSQRGIVALILNTGAGLTGTYNFTSLAQIPKTFPEETLETLERVFLGYVNPPRMVRVFFGDVADALEYYSTQEFNWLAGPPDLTEEQAEDIADWVRRERLNGHKVRAVLPNYPADDEAIVNFTATEIKTAKGTFDTAAYCSRIAGLLAGTPITISCTYAQLPEVTDITRLQRLDEDEAIDRGELILTNDGKRIKIGRGVNSLQTTTDKKNDAWKKIKAIEAIDMIETDIRTTAQNVYIGKFANSYDNKCLLITAIKNYFITMEQQGVLKSGFSVVEIDLDKQTEYLQELAVDTSEMSEIEIKTADTRDKVFIRARIKILDAIEDIDIAVTV